MKKIVVIVFAGLLVSAGLQAQKVYIDEDVQGNKRVILDMTVAAGMPAGAVTNVSKINSTGSLADNLQVFQKLEIAPSDLGAMTWTWADAMAGCKNKGTGWRLPTQRELIMMWIFKDVLNDNALPVVGGDALSSAVSPPLNYYRSATETSPSASTAWLVDFDTGYTSSSETISVRVRCVREVTTP